MELMERSQDKPEWEEVALSSQCVKTLWNQWPRLVIQDGLLKRRFEDINDSVTGGLASYKEGRIPEDSAWWNDWRTPGALQDRICRTGSRVLAIVVFGPRQVLGAM